MTLRSGMTLVELVVALTIGSIALAFGGVSFSLLIDRRAALLADAERAERALNARRALVAWVAEAGNRMFAQELLLLHGTRRTAAGQIPDDTLRFITSEGGMLRRMRLFIDRSAPHPAFVAIAEGGAGGDSAVTQLAGDVAGFEARIRTSAFGRREWRDAWTHSALIPEAIVVRLWSVEGSALPAELSGDITIPLAGAR